RWAGGVAHARSLREALRDHERDPTRHVVVDGGSGDSCGRGTYAPGDSRSAPVTVTPSRGGAPRTRTAASRVPYGDDRNSRCPCWDGPAGQRRTFDGGRAPARSAAYQPNAPHPGRSLATR